MRPFSLYSIISTALTIYTYIVLARCVISWVAPNTYNSFTKLVYDLTEPPIVAIRKVVPPLGMVDISAFILLILINILNRILYAILL